MEQKKLGGRLWWNIILFSLVGQLAWNVENMYFNTFLYNKIYAGVSQTAIDGTIPVMSAISTMVAEDPLRHGLDGNRHGLRDDVHGFNQ